MSHTVRNLITTAAALAIATLITSTAYAMPAMDDPQGGLPGEGFSAPVVVESSSGLELGSVALGAGAALVALLAATVLLSVVRRHRGAQAAATA